MANELADIVSETHWRQRSVRSYGRLSWLARQHKSFQNANSAVASAGTRGSSLAATPAASTFAVPSMEGQIERFQGVANTGGNVLGFRLGRAEQKVTDARGQILLFSGLASTPTKGSYGSWLEEALEELSACPDDAIEDGIDAPSELGLKKARALIMELVMHVPSQPDIYSMDQGSVAIDIRHSNGKVGVLCLVEKDGSGVLFSRSLKSKGRVRVDDAADLLRESGLSELRRLGISL